MNRTNLIPEKPSGNRRGVVLVVVLLVVALLSLSAYTFSDLMLVEHTAAQTHADMAKTREAAISGAAVVQAFLLQDPQTRNDAGGIYDNPAMFFARQVHMDDEVEFQTLCSITSPAYDSNGIAVGVRSGLENESGRLNLNWLLELSDAAAQAAATPAAATTGTTTTGTPTSGTTAPGTTTPVTTTPVTTATAVPTPTAATGVDPDSTSDPARDALMRLPGMTLEIADAILDWIDTDDEPRDYGAEIDYYSSLDPPYEPRNGPLGSIDELLMVRGVMPDLLFGRDQNRSGSLEENETTLVMISEIDESSGGSIDLGWASMLTTYSAEVAPLNPNGEEKIALGEVDDVQAVVDELSGYVSQDLANFVGAFIAFGPYDGDEDGVSISGATIDFSSSQGDSSLESFVDLIDAKVEADGTVYSSPLQSDSLSSEIDLLQDYATTLSAEDLTLGRININEATFSVLMAIPGMTEPVASTIVSQRDPTIDLATSPRRNPTWLLSEGLVDLATMQEMDQFLTTGGDVFRAQVVGYFGDGSGVSRADIILDATRPDIPLLLWKDKTDLGRGFTRQDLVGDASAEEQ